MSWIAKTVRHRFLEQGSPYGRFGIIVEQIIQRVGLLTYRSSVLNQCCTEDRDIRKPDLKKLSMRETYEVEKDLGGIAGRNKIARPSCTGLKLPGVLAQRSRLIQGAAMGSGQVPRHAHA